MKGTILLKKAILVDGKERKQFKYDDSKITSDQFLEADLRSHEKAAELGKINLQVAELDNSFQMYLGMMAILAEEPTLDIADLQRIGGPDIMELLKIGRNFIKGSAEEEETAENLDSEESN